MKLHKNILMGLLLLLFISCGSKDTITPPPDEVNALIDRAGRPYMAQLFVGPFRNNTDRNTKLNDYNITPTDQLLNKFQKEVNEGLAGYDSVFQEPGSVSSCGDNPITNRTDLETSSPLGTNINRYNAFSELLLDDQIYINRNADTEMVDLGNGLVPISICNAFMAVELTKMGFTTHPGANEDPSTDCGGHKPSQEMDITDTYYSLTIRGTSSPANAINDGLDLGGGAGITDNFPFLGTAVSTPE